MNKSARHGVEIFRDLRAFATFENNSELVWLDPQVNTREENREAQVKLQEIIYPLKTFKDQQSCYQYIQRSFSSTQITLIVNGYCGQQLVPRIHHFKQITDIYVFCLDKQRNEQWTKDFSKVEMHCERVFSSSSSSFISR